MPFLRDQFLTVFIGNNILDAFPSHFMCERTGYGRFVCFCFIRVWEIGFFRVKQIRFTIDWKRWDLIRIEYDDNGWHNNAMSHSGVFWMRLDAANNGTVKEPKQKTKIGHFQWRLQWRRANYRVADRKIHFIRSQVPTTNKHPIVRIVLFIVHCAQSKEFNSMHEMSTEI